MSPKYQIFQLPQVLLKCQCNLLLLSRFAFSGSAMSLFDLKTGIDLQFTDLCLIKVNAAMVVNSNQRIKALWNPSLHPLASEVHRSRCILHRADRERVKGLACGVFSDDVNLSTELLLIAVTSLAERDSGSIFWVFPSHLLPNQTVFLLWLVSVTF